MMAQIGVHNNDEFTSGALHAMDIGRSQAQLRRSWPQNNQLLAVNPLQILGHVQRSIRTSIVDHNYLKFKITKHK